MPNQVPQRPDTSHGALIVRAWESSRLHFNTQGITYANMGNSRMSRYAPSRRSSRRNQSIRNRVKDSRFRQLRHEQLEDRRMLTLFAVDDFNDTVDANPGDGVAEDVWGNTTLRAAIMEANALAGDDMIMLGAATYSFTLGGASEDGAATGDLDVAGNLSIIGAGAGTSIIDAANVDRVFDVLLGADLTLSEVTITGGALITYQGGGGIRNNSGGVLTIIDSDVSGNSTIHQGGGVWNVGVMDVIRSTISNNSAGKGAGLFNFNVGLTVNAATITDSTIAQNEANDDGGGIHNAGIMTISNSTISENTSLARGGGVYGTIGSKAATLTIVNTTVADNSAERGGGIYMVAGTISAKNTLIASNTATASESDVGGSFNSLGHNLIGDGIGASGFADGVNSDLVGNSSSRIDPLLGPLADHGGPTWTRALLPGSPAIDTGDSAGAPTSDQRGELRPQDGNTDGIAVVDIGAFEVSHFVVNAVNDEFSVDENGGPTDLRVLANDSGPGALVLDSFTTPAHATLVDNGDGTLAFTPEAGFSGDTTFSYTVAVDEAKLTAAAADVNDQFGISVSISGDTAIVGAYLDDDLAHDAGAAYVFVRSGVLWTQQAKLTAHDAAADDQLGRSVSVSGDTAVVGAWSDDDAGSWSGSAYVFVRSGTTWSEQAKLTAADAAAFDQFGQSVSISGDTAVISSPRDDDAGANSGSAYVFIRSETTWNEQAKLTAGDAEAGDQLGESVSISGDTVVVGAHLDDDGGTDSGSVYVFVRSGTTWSQQAKLSASDAAADDEFGSSVSLSGSTAVVGAYRNDGAGSDAGSAYVFVRTGTTWSEQAKLAASDAANGDQFGYSVSLSGDMAIIGDRSAVGSAYVFVRSDNAWTQQDVLTASDAEIADGFGQSVAISGETAVIASHLDDDGGADSGSAYICQLGSDSATVTVTVVPRTRHWQGDVDNNWSTPGNWLEDLAPIDGDILVFDTATSGFAANYSPTNDLTDLRLDSISIVDDSGSGDFALGGNAITLNAGLTTAGTSGIAHIDLAGIALNGSQTFTMDIATEISSGIDSEAAGARPDLTIISQGGPLQLGGIGTTPGKEIGNLSIDAFGASTLTGDVISNGGQILLRASEAIINPDLIVRSNGGQIVFSVDDLILNTSGTLVDASSVSVYPTTPGRPIDIGTNASGALGLSSAELDRITADVLRIGNSNVGPITISDAVDPGGTDTLHLISGDAVSQSATVTVGNLAVEAGGGITLDMHPNEVDNLAMSAGTSGVQYRDATGFTVTTVDNVSGIHSASSIGLTAWTGDVTLVNTSAAEDLDAALGMYIRLRGNEALLKLESGANLRGDVNLIADKMDLAGTITAVGETVTLQPYWSRNDAVNLGSTSDDATDTLELSDAELDRITTDVLRIGNSNVGPITISDAVDPGGTDTLHLISGDAVSQSATVTVGNLAVEAGGGITLDMHPNEVDNLAMSAGTSGVQYRDATGFTVTTVDNVSGIHSASSIGLTAWTGDVTLVNTSAAEDLDAALGMYIRLRGNEALLKLEAGRQSARRRESDRRQDGPGRNHHGGGRDGHTAAVLVSQRRG